jgi:YfiH family protein
VGRDGFRLVDEGGVRLARCEALDAIPGIAHAFSTRVAHGRSDFDLGPAGEAPPEVSARRRAFWSAAGLSGAPPPILRQVHGTSVVEDGVPAEADGGIAVFSMGTSAAPAVRSADCVTILLVDRSGSAVASAHAGWRGTAARIAELAVRRLGERGVPAERLVAVLGPAVGACCYEVGPDVVEALGGFSRPSGSGRITVDLHAANADQLASAGVPPRAIHRAPWCTRCRNDLFFSVRAEGAGAGRLMAVIGKSGQS